MKRTSLIIFFMLCMFSLMSCGSSGDQPVKTSQEFVQKYSQAYKDGNVKALVKMTDLVDDKSKEVFKDDAQKDIKSKGFGYRAWANTRYISEQNYDKHIRVEVGVSGGRSSIVLIKQAEGLKLALNPSDYE